MGSWLVLQVKTPARNRITQLHRPCRLQFLQLFELVELLNSFRRPSLPLSLRATRPYDGPFI